MPNITTNHAITYTNFFVCRGTNPLMSTCLLSNLLSLAVSRVPYLDAKRKELQFDNLLPVKVFYNLPFLTRSEMVLVHGCVHIRLIKKNVIFFFSFLKLPMAD